MDQVIAHGPRMMMPPANSCIANEIGEARADGARALTVLVVFLSLGSSYVFGLWSFYLLAESRNV